MVVLLHCLLCNISGNSNQHVMTRHDWSFVELLSAQEPALPLLFLPCLTDAGSVFFVLQVHVSVHAVTTQCCRCHHDGTLTACDSREFAIQPRCMIYSATPTITACACWRHSQLYSTAQHACIMSIALFCVRIPAASCAPQQALCGCQAYLRGV